MLITNLRWELIRTFRSSVWFLILLCGGDPGPLRFFVDGKIHTRRKLIIID
jgi:hypothetical protein